MSGAPSSSAARTTRSLLVSTSLTQSPGAFARRGAPRRSPACTISPPARGGPLGNPEQRVEIEVRSAHSHDRREQGVDQLRRRAGDELAARVGVDHREVAARARRGRRRRPRCTRAAHPGSPTDRAGRATRRPCRRAGPTPTSQSATRRRAERAELLPRQHPERHPRDRDHRILDPLGLRRAQAALAVALGALPRTAVDASPGGVLVTSEHSGPSASSAHSEIPQYGISRAQFVEPSTGSTTTVTSAPRSPDQPDSSLTTATGAGAAPRSRPRRRRRRARTALGGRCGHAEPRRPAAPAPRDGRRRPREEREERVAGSSRPTHVARSTRSGCE